MRNALPVTSPERASEITDARIGPTHGAQRSPRLAPSKRPPENPVLF